MKHRFATGLFILLTLLFGWRFAQDRQFWESLQQIPPWQVHTLPLFIAVVALVPLNWILEGLKWRLFLPREIRQGLWPTMQIVLAGLTFAILSPGRLGDYIGRGLMAKPELREETVLATFLGNFCQFFVLLGAGIPAIWFLFPLLNESGWGKTQFPLWQVYAWFGICFGFLTGYRAIFQLLGQLAAKASITKTWANKLETVSRTGRLQLAWGILLAGMRYLVFSLQYFLIMQLWGDGPGLREACLGICSLYLFQTILPLPPFYSLLARGEASVFIWGLWSIPPLTALVGSYLLFFLNLFLPAILGLLILVPSRRKSKLLRPNS